MIKMKKGINQSQMINFSQPAVKVKDYNHVMLVFPKCLAFSKIHPWHILFGGALQYNGNKLYDFAIRKGEHKEP